MNGLPLRHDATVRESLPENVAPQGFPQTSNVSSRGSAGFPNPLKATPAVKLLREAVFYIDAANSQAGERYALNQGTGGPALNAKYGNSDVASTNDPLWLPRPVDGTNYVYLPGANSNALSTASAAALDISGDMELVWDGSLSDVTNLNMHYMVKDDSVANRSWYFTQSATGTLQFVWWDSGGTVRVCGSSTTFAMANGARFAVKVTIDVDNGAGGHDVKFWTSTHADGTWTQLGTTRNAGAFTTSIRVTSSAVGVGCSQTLTFPATAPMKVYRAIVRSDLVGTVVLDINCPVDVTSSSATSFTCTSGQTVTVNRSTSGRKTVLVTRSIWLFGTDDHMEVPNHPLLGMGTYQMFSLVAVYRRWATSGSVASIMTTKVDLSNSGVPGWGLRGVSTPKVRFVYADGIVAQGPFADTGTETYGSLSCVVGVQSGQSSLRAYLNGVGGTVGTLSISGPRDTKLPLTIGATATGSNPADMELVAAAVFRRALTATEIATINSYYGTA